MKINHIMSIFKDGKRTANNIKLVHKHCHHKKRALISFVDFTKTSTTRSRMKGNFHVRF